METFEYTALPARVIFGFGTLPRIADEVAALGCKRAFVLSDPHHATAAAARLMDALGKLGVQLSTDAVMHTPTDVTERVMAKLVATESAQRVIDDAVQLHGARGVVRGECVERLYREIRALRIYEGATEVQRLVIGRELLRPSPAAP